MLKVPSPSVNGWMLIGSRLQILFVRFSRVIFGVNYVLLEASISRTVNDTVRLARDPCEADQSVDDDLKNNCWLCTIYCVTCTIKS